MGDRTRGYVTLAYNDVMSSRMPAVLFGIWAVHRCPHEPDNPDAIGWRITHAPSGMNLALLADAMAFRDACRIAALLNHHLPDLTVDASDEDKRIVEATFAEVLS